MDDKDNSLRDRVVIVTGGSRGLGREMALELVERGARVMVTASAESAALQETVRQAQALSGDGRLHGMAADVTDYASCQAVVAETLSRFGALHVLVNNAALGMGRVSETFNSVPIRFWEIAPDDWRDIIDTNVNGVFNMARACVPHMVAQKFGKVINVSTSDHTMIRRGFSPYGPSKAAIEAASRSWADDLEGAGVDVNVYLPGGAADTDMMPKGPGRHGALGDLLPASVIRRGIAWLCSDASNGQTARRYSARLWDDSLPAPEAAAKASVPGRFMPS